MHFGRHAALEDAADALIKESLKGVYSHSAKSDILTPWKDQDRHRREIYCLAPDTLVLCSDLVWRPLREVHVGDDLIAFEEEATGYYRQFRVATVTHADPVVLPSYLIVMKDGRSVVASSGHAWLMRHRSAAEQSHPGWVTTQDLQAGASVFDLGTPWGGPLESRGAGYLAGLYDGEGCLDPQLYFCQKPGVTMDRARSLIKELGFEVTNHKIHSSGVDNFTIAGGKYEVMKFLGQLQPHRLIAKVPAWIEKFAINKIGFTRVASVEYLGQRKLVGIETTTSTLIAEGLLSHNTSVGTPDASVRRGMFHRAANPTRPDLNSRDGLARSNRISSSLAHHVEEHGQSASD